MVAALTSRTGGAAASTLASTAWLISIMPSEVPLRVERGGAGKAGHRHRLAQLDGAAVGEPRLDLGELAAAVLLFGSGMPTSVTSRRLPPSAHRRERQRRQSCARRRRAAAPARCLVVGDAVGVAEPGGDDHLAAFDEPAVGDDVALRAHHEAGAVFHRRASAA